VVKPVEIDDVPILTLTLTGADSYTLRRVGEEAAQRLAALPDVSRAYVVGGEPRTVRADLEPVRLQAYSLSPLEVRKALTAANVTLSAGELTRADAVLHVDASRAVARPEQQLDKPVLPCPGLFGRGGPGLR
jgi:multidrug efflux pump subunit AcrB